MSIITSITRAWLTRSPKPFRFLREYDNALPYLECENLGLYVHIPFCRSICSFCPYCKQVYDESTCNEYVDALLEEIRLVGAQSPQRKRATSLYFGGGTPALAKDRLGEIIHTLGRYFDITGEIGVELHPADVTEATLRTLRDAGVTALSIGIQSFLPKYQTVLGRSAPNRERIKEALERVPFPTVSIDLIFALPEQTAEELTSDVDTAVAIGANHVALYPFIDFTFTKSSVPAMAKKEKQRLLYEITDYCTARGFARTSIWTFATEQGARYSSMTRENFLGFGASATTLLNKQFKINTFSVAEYCKRIQSGRLPTALTLRFTLRQRMVYFLFWTAYSTRVNEEDFQRFFGVPLKKAYGFELRLAVLLGFAKKKNGVYTMTKKGTFYYHYYENFYTLSYIDRMWGILRTDAFPDKIEL